jgi:hypothetical protein
MTRRVGRVVLWGVAMILVVLFVIWDVDSRPLQSEEESGYTVIRASGGQRASRP